MPPVDDLIVASQKRLGQLLDRAESEDKQADRAGNTPNRHNDGQSSCFFGLQRSVLSYLPNLRA